MAGDLLNVAAIGIGEVDLFDAGLVADEDDSAGSEAGFAGDGEGEIVGERLEVFVESGGCVGALEKKFAGAILQAAGDASAD